MRRGSGAHTEGGGYEPSTPSSWKEHRRRPEWPRRVLYLVIGLVTTVIILTVYVATRIAARAGLVADAPPPVMMTAEELEVSDSKWTRETL